MNEETTNFSEEDYTLAPPEDCIPRPITIKWKKVEADDLNIEINTE